MRIEGRGERVKTEYEELRTDVWVRGDRIGELHKVDGLILDIDGVILDVTSSFRVAISQTVQYYFSKVVGFSGETTLLTPQDTQLFKLAGGFNNDWDLTSGAILFYLAKSKELSIQDISVLREQGESLEDFTADVRHQGGGMDAARLLALGRLTEGERREVDKEWDQAGIRRIFQEFYGGIDYCQRLYGFRPSLIDEKGLLSKEKVLLDTRMLDFFYPKVAILTGRTREETKIALERAGILEKIPRNQIFSDGEADESMKKPHPGALLKLAEIMESKVCVYAGDVLDDLLVVENANRAQNSRNFLSCIVVSPARREEVPFYQERKTDIITLDINKALKVVGRKGKTG
jgi:HAD superfamily hydrolase (TIGR01548 family)